MKYSVNKNVTLWQMLAVALCLISLPVFSVSAFAKVLIAIPKPVKIGGPAGENENCDDGQGCKPGLECVSDDNQNFLCRPIRPKPDLILQNSTAPSPDSLLETK